jgi:hypothetical protein
MQPPYIASVCTFCIQLSYAASVYSQTYAASVDTLWIQIPYTASKYCLGLSFHSLRVHPSLQFAYTTSVYSLHLQPGYTVYLYSLSAYTAYVYNLKTTSHMLYNYGLQHSNSIGLSVCLLQPQQISYRVQGAHAAVVNSLQQRMYAAFHRQDPFTFTVSPCISSPYN